MLNVFELGFDAGQISLDEELFGLDVFGVDLGDAPPTFLLQREMVGILDVLNVIRRRVLENSPKFQQKFRNIWRRNINFKSVIRAVSSSRWKTDGFLLNLFHKTTPHKSQTLIYFQGSQRTHVIGLVFPRSGGFEPRKGLCLRKIPESFWICFVFPKRVLLFYLLVLPFASWTEIVASFQGKSLWPKF